MSRALYELRWRAVPGSWDSLQSTGSKDKSVSRPSDRRCNLSSSSAPSEVSKGQIDRMLNDGLLVCACTEAVYILEAVYTGRITVG